MADRPSSALLFTGPPLLSVDEVVAAGMELIGSPRTMRTLPGYRAALQRVSAALPGLSRTVLPMITRMGERRRLSR